MAQPDTEISPNSAALVFVTGEMGLLGSQLLLDVFASEDPITLLHRV